MSLSLNPSFSTFAFISSGVSANPLSIRICPFGEVIRNDVISAALT